MAYVIFDGDRGRPFVKDAVTHARTHARNGASTDSRTEQLAMLLCFGRVLQRLSQSSLAASLGGFPIA